MAAADCDPLIFCPNDAIALFAPALPARTLDKPGAPVGMLKFQFDPLPSPLSGILSQAATGTWGGYRACRLSLCLRPSENCGLGDFAAWRGRTSFGMAQGQHLVVRDLGQHPCSQVMSEVDGGLCLASGGVACLGVPGLFPSTAVCRCYDWTS